MLVVEIHSPEALAKSRQFVEGQGYLIKEIRMENRFGRSSAGLLCN